MQEELDQKDRTIRELKMQIDEIADLEREVKQREQNREHSSLKERLEENKKNCCRARKEKTHTVQIMIEECRDKQRQAEQERDYALSHQKK